MLDTPVTLFNISITGTGKHNDNNRLTFSSCKAIVYDPTYSEFDEATFASLNDNNGYGYIEYEFAFKENFENPYMSFYVSCFAIRMNTLGYGIKVNGLHTQNIPKFMREHNYTKVNKDGNLSFGIRYFFRSTEEHIAVLSCDKIIIEGFTALGKKTNTYGIMTRLEKRNNNWDLIDANTYKLDKNGHVYSYIH